MWMVNGMKLHTLAGAQNHYRKNPYDLKVSEAIFDPLNKQHSTPDA
jgi:hypothetical protein